MTLQSLQLVCLHCGYHWLRRIDGRPVKCPQCQNRKWDKPRTETKKEA